MKCVKCGRETGANWKKLCLPCWKEEQREKEDRNYKNAIEAGEEFTYAHSNADGEYID